MKYSSKVRAANWELDPQGCCFGHLPPSWGWGPEPDRPATAPGQMQRTATVAALAYLAARSRSCPGCLPAMRQFRWDRPMNTPAKPPAADHRQPAERGL